MNKRIRHLSAADYMKGNEMDAEQIKQLATDVNNVALASFQSGKEHIERPLMAKIDKLKVENEKLKNSMICLWCKKTMPKDTVKLTEHLLECKDHPLARRIEQLQAELDKRRWIPVSEGLPEDEYDILAYGEDGYGYKIVVNTSYNLEFKKFRILSNVTHWKPIILPEQALKETND